MSQAWYKEAKHRREIRVTTVALAPEVQASDGQKKGPRDGYDHHCHDDLQEEMYLAGIAAVRLTASS